MNYSKKDIIIGFVIIILIIVGAFYYKKIQTSKSIVTDTPMSIEFKKELEDSFKFVIPEDSNAIELKGDGRGLATSKEILADVDNPEANYFYQGWIEDKGNLVSLGKLIEGKGGWMLEYPEISNIKGKKIVVSLEKDFDSKVERIILEGSFN